MTKTYWLKEPMFTQPENGWANFNILRYMQMNYNPNCFNTENILSFFRVSYIQDIHLTMFNHLIDLFQEKNYKSQIITFDAEGYSWSILLDYYSDDSIQIKIPKEVFNPFEPSGSYLILNLYMCATFEEFAWDWCNCYQKYRIEWNEFCDYEEKCFDENSHSLLDEKYDTLISLLKEREDNGK